jgi:RHS repeat-associated protein
MGLRALLDAGSPRQLDEHDGHWSSARRPGLLVAIPLASVSWPSVLNGGLSRMWRLRRLLALVLVVLSGVGFLQSGVASASGLPEIETNHMTEIEEWVYRDAAIKDPLPCGSTCAALWSAEHKPLPETPAAQELWDKLGALFLEKTKLWGSLTELRDTFNNSGSFTLGASPIKVGWHIGNGEGSKWMELIGPTAPSESIGCTPKAVLKLTNEEVYKTSYSNPLAPGNEWYMIGCGNGTVVAEYANAENPSQPENKCNKNQFNFTLAGWTKQEWQWNLCGEGFYEGKEVWAPIYAEGFYKNFHFGRIEDWTGQRLEENLSTRNVQTIGQSDPGRTVTREAIEKVLEESPAGRGWIQWVIEGEKGGEPLGITPGEGFGPGAPGSPKCFSGKPVNCATGNEVESQTDLTMGGRGPGLRVTRTYNAQLAARQSAHGLFGYGWTGSYSAHVELSEEQKVATVYQDDGSTVGFFRSGEKWVPANPLVLATLISETGGYLYTLPNQTVFHFNTSGQLTSEVDRNGNGLTMNRNGEGRLESVSDPAGRKLVFAYNGEGLIESVTDPMGHVVKYTYEVGNLASVTLPGETAPNWQFKYDSQHRLTSRTDGRGGKTTNEYDSENRVISQTDAAERTLTFQYEPSRTRVTNKATGAVTDEHYSADNELVSITHGYGTASATTSEYTYDSAGNLASVSDGNKHITKYEYDSAGDRIKMVDPNGHETKWTYDSTHDVETVTTPKGETTTIKRDSHGNAETVSRPAPTETTQTTKYTYDSHGDVESMTDPLGRVWKYEYDNAGDRTAEIDPEGDKRTWGYNEDSQKTSTVSPRGNVTGGEPSKYTTTIERDARGRALKVTDPLGHATKYAYDANGNLETVTDPNNHTTTYTYDADNEPIKVKKANGIVTETGYDGAGQVTSQNDGNKHETKYVRNILEQVTEQIDPLGRKTTKEYDAAGNLKKLTDAAARSTTYTYDLANRLTEISYSDGKTHAVKYEYDADGDRTSIVDGTGTSSYTYDQLDRLTEGKDGHGDKTSYEYDLANQQTKITYPNGNAVTQSYDKAGRLEKVTDWLEHTTRFTYDPDSNLVTTTFPTGTNNVDKYAYNEADQISEVVMTKGAETLASLVYARDNDGQVKTITSKGLPGEEKPGYEYDANNRLTKAGSNTYEYDSADNPTKIPGSTNTYDNADQLKTGTSITYTYDELGERTKRAPTSGAATTYGYDQAGNLISVTRPKEAKTAEIKDTYAYDGNGLRTSQTITSTTSFLTWDMAASLPVILNDGTNSYIYGPGGLPVEQISSGGTVTYLHHDQQGSTRLSTSSTGAVVGAYTYTPYGAVESHTGTATTPLGYDGQYTSSDTGLIYLRARVYDPATAQFLSRDPLVSLTREPYAYAVDNPLNLGDPTGYETLPLPIEGPAGAALCADPVTAAICIGAGGYIIAKGAETIVNAWTGEEGGDEGEAELKRREAERESACSPNFNNPAEPPGPGWEWHGNGPEGSDEGAWVNPNTGETLHPDLNHPEPIGPHFDYKAPDGSEYRIYPDGRIEPNP